MMRFHLAVEQYVPSQPMDDGARPQRVLQRIDRRQADADRPRSDDDRRNRKMQPVDRAGRQETGYGPGSAFDQQTSKPARGHRLDDFQRVDLTIAACDRDRRNPGRARPVVTLDDNNRTSILGQDSRIQGQASVRVDDNARWIVAGHFADGQPRVVGENRTDADDDRVDQRPQPMQMQDRLGAIDITGAAGSGRDPPVKGLPELADNERPWPLSGGNGLIEVPK